MRRKAPKAAPNARATTPGNRSPSSEVQAAPRTPSSVAPPPTLLVSSRRGINSLALCSPGRPGDKLGLFLPFLDDGFTLLHLVVFQHRVVDVDAAELTRSVVGTEHVENRRGRRRPVRRHEIALHHHGTVVIFRVFQQHLVQLPQPIVRNTGEQVMRQVVVLSDGEHREVDAAMDEEDARVGQPAAVAVAVLHQLPQDHEERERREQRHQPQQEIVHRRPAARQMRHPRQTVENSSVMKVRRQHRHPRAARSPDGCGSGGTCQPGRSKKKTMMTSHSTPPAARPAAADRRGSTRPVSNSDKASR